MRLGFDVVVDSSQYGEPIEPQQAASARAAR
jgi:hypothetical protein